MFYSLTTPLILASPTMFWIFKESMFKGEVCKFYELANSQNDQQDCLANYADNSEYYIEKAGFRYPAFQMGLYAPVGFFLVELCFNQILISWKQLPLQYLFTVAYAMVTAAWQVSTGDAVIYPGRLDWNSADLFNDCILWFIYFSILQTICFAFVLLLHYVKSKFCCKVSVPIIAFQENEAKDLGSLTKNE